MNRLHFLLADPFMAAGLSQALGGAAGIINALGFIAVFGGMIGMVVGALSRGHVSGIKDGLVIAVVGALAWTILTAMFTAGGQQTNVQLQPIN